MRNKFIHKNNDVHFCFKKNKMLYLAFKMFQQTFKYDLFNLFCRLFKKMR